MLISSISVSMTTGSIVIHASLPNVTADINQSSVRFDEHKIFRIKVRAGSADFINTGRKDGNVLFNDALNTFYLRSYGVKHIVKDHSDSERGNPLPPHRLLFPIISKGSFICTIPQTG